MCLLGAPGDTPNLGVTALHQSTLSGLAERLPTAELTVFDNGFGVRDAAYPVEGSGRLRFVGVRVSRRLHRPESLARIRASARLGGLGNPAARALVTADAVLDISGGDSFSDIYSPLQQRMTIEPKRLALRLRRPLLLLPQTYGPFTDDRVRRTARSILCAAEAAWARDADAYAQLQDLLGAEFTPDRHHAGVDVAFRLPSVPPTGLSSHLRRWLEPQRPVPVAGVNVSGMLYNRSDAADRFGLSVDYPALMRELVVQLLERSDANVVLVSHVLGASPASDEQAATDLVASLPGQHRSRVAVAPALSTPGEVKGLVSRLDWLCGTRMHATIAALSSGVPASVIAYSPKARGVFATCGVADEVVDARRADDRTALQALLDSWHRRGATRKALGRELPAVLHKADEQMDAIAQRVRALAVADRRDATRHAPATAVGPNGGSR